MTLPQRSSLVNGAGSESGPCCQNGLPSSPKRRQPMEHSAWLAGISSQRPSKNPVCRLSENFLNIVCDTIGCLFWSSCWPRHEFIAPSPDSRGRRCWNSMRLAVKSNSGTSHWSTSKPGRQQNSSGNPASDSRPETTAGSDSGVHLATHRQRPEQQCQDVLGLVINGLQQG